ncbi:MULTISPECIES: DUF3054 domain-containing protein [Micrococcaceae]|uniref:DUF3054 domain-containing protein n=1 Tax=unclassified Kocuria TaxID=2649579 RepID=UPI001EE0DCD8|nr:MULTISPECIES: DUF3054 domain-containing protein [unclassified Kocuria]
MTQNASVNRNNASSHPRMHKAPVWLFLVADIVLVVVFAAIGRSSHGENLSGTFSTAWPFLAGAVIGWLIVRAWRAPQAVFPTGITVWLATVIVGMVLRAIVGEGTHWSFILVATIVNAVFLIGYRLLVKLLTRRAATRH